MKLINKNTFKIVDTTKQSEYSRSAYFELPDEMYAKIQEFASYTDGIRINENGEEVANVVYLKNIDSIETQAGVLHDVVTNIVFTSKQEAIEAYEAEKINKEFRGRKYKIVVHDLNAVFAASIEFVAIWAKLKENKNIIVEALPQTIENEITIMPYALFYNVLSEADISALETAQGAGLVEVFTNPNFIDTLEVIT